MPPLSVQNDPFLPRQIGFADIYDRVVGADFWHYWWPAFNRLVAEHGLNFSRVCDVACGTGETALRLARAGKTVYATDISEQMIRKAREKCADTPVQLMVQPMEALRLPEPVELIICAYDSLNMVAERADLLPTLRGFFAALSPGGHVVCDLATVRHLADDWGSGEIHATVDEIDTVWHTVWDAEQRRSTIHFTATLPDAQERLSVVTCRVQEWGFSQQEIDYAIHAAGLTVCAVHDMIPWTSGTDHGQRLFYLLQRPSENSPHA